MTVNDSVINQLIELVESPNTSQRMFSVIIDEHSACFGGELCDVCDYLEHDYMARFSNEHAWQELMPMIARNSSLSATHQMELFHLSSKDLEKWVTRLHSFLENDNLADAVKDKFLSGEVLIPAEDLEWWLEIAKIMVEHNARFTADEVKQFVKVFESSS